MRFQFSLRDLLWLTLVVALPFESVGCSRSESASPASKSAIIAGEDLIQGLTSKNEAPRVIRSESSSRSSVVLPESYSLAEQQRVFECYRRILDREADVFPVLVAHLDDRQYSLTIFFDDYFYRYTDGMICSRALRVQLDWPYLEQLRTRGPVDWNTVLSYVHNVIGEGERARKWAADHRGKPLAEIQIEAIQWILDGAKQIDGREPPPVEEFPEPGGLRKLQQQLQTTGRPVRLSDSGARPREGNPNRTE